MLNPQHVLTTSKKPVTLAMFLCGNEVKRCAVEESPTTLLSPPSYKSIRSVTKSKQFEFMDSPFCMNTVAKLINRVRVIVGLCELINAVASAKYAVSVPPNEHSMVKPALSVLVTNMKNK